MRNLENKARMETWSVQSPEEPGFHAVITPDTCECQETQIYRLNLPKGQSHTLESGDLEMHPVLIEGAAQLSEHPQLNQTMKQFDAFYIPGNDRITITALEDCIFYVAAAKYEGYGKPLFRAFDLSQPVGDIHQIHGTGVGQHEKDLEEIYCYFGMPLPHFGFHISYLKSGEVEDIVTHTVHSGTMVQAPVGYHPTVASPGTRNSYLWVLGALRHSSRSYNLAVLDPALENFNS